ncbi:MAG: hypothetical protein KDJ47_07905 [Hyphomicrobiaceae bacterium]|nr:hypothetical protein [Hyphomicrobiaceae bacterium]
MLVTIRAMPACFATIFLVGIAGSATPILAADQPQVPAVSDAEAQANSRKIKEMTAPEKLVVDENGAKYPETGPAKPIESWTSACPPVDASASSTVKNDCRKLDDKASTVNGR